MQYGVYTSLKYEIALTQRHIIVFYSNKYNTVFGTKLYSDTDGEKKLIGACEHNKADKTTGYAFINSNGEKLGNSERMKNMLDMVFISPDTFSLKMVDDIEIIPTDTPMSSVSDAGIGKCLKLWKLGNSLQIFEDALQFTMNTDKLEYVCIIRCGNDDIYCGASVTIPFDGGLFGGRQYFRIRNYGDNSKPYCAFHCSLGNDIVIPEFDNTGCKTGQCTLTKQGLIWGVKRYTDDEIILQGCGDDEYPYYRNLYMTERFKPREELHE